MPRQVDGLYGGGGGSPKAARFARRHYDERYGVPVRRAAEAAAAAGTPTKGCRAVILPRPVLYIIWGSPAATGDGSTAVVNHVHTLPVCFVLSIVRAGSILQQAGREHDSAMPAARRAGRAPRGRRAGLRGAPAHRGRAHAVRGSAPGLIPPCSTTQPST